MRRSRLHVMGASGSGATTLARAVADRWSVPHADSDDYFWCPSDPPFTEPRPVPERLELMQRLFVPREAWVLSGSVTGWGEPVVAACDAIVFLTLAPEERMRRLDEREVRRRAGQGFDGAAWADFRAWAAGYDDPAFDGRTRATHEAWLARVEQPVLRLDAARPRTELLEAVLAWDPE